MRHLRALGALTLVGSLGGCLPYTMGNTALPAPEHEVQATGSWYFLPSGIEPYDSSANTIPLHGVDLEARFGLDDQSDVGVRLIGGFTGITVTYKRLLTPTHAASQYPAVAFQVGGGMVNLANHLLIDGALLWSAPDAGVVVPYAGLRVMQVVPVTAEAVSDAPTAGGYLGIRLGSRDLGVSPEVGVFYDRPALGLRTGNIVAVFSISVHGERLIRALLGWR